MLTIERSSVEGRMARPGSGSEVIQRIQHRFQRGRIRE